MRQIHAALKLAHRYSQAYEKQLLYHLMHMPKTWIIKTAQNSGDGYTANMLHILAAYILWQGMCKYFSQSF